MSRKSMPYRLEEGAIQRMKFSCKAAVACAAAAKRREKKQRKIALSAAVAACVVLAVCVFVNALQPTNYERFIIQVAEAPIDALYEMSADVVEYAEDINLL